jgi:hypothetical protein
MMTQPCGPPSTSLVCGYRSLCNFKAMVYLLTGKLDLKLPA